MQVVGLIFGILSVGGMFLFFLPLLGWLNWLNIPFAIVGLIFSIIGTAGAKANRGVGIAGIVLCCTAIVVGFVRLKMGCGIL